MSDDISDIIARINKKEQLIVRGSDLLNMTWQRATTGNLGIDLALGGGWPLDGVNEVIGQSSSGKTTLCVKTIAAQQARDPDYHAVWAAAEEFDYAWAQRLGMDLNRVDFITTNIMEDVYQISLDLAAARAVDAIVLDSLPALIPNEEAGKDMMELTVGRGAYMTNKWMRKAAAANRRSLTKEDRHLLLLIINQWRERVGAYGDPKTTPGGKGKDYAALTRVEVQRTGWLKVGTKKVGQQQLYKVIKNKTAPPQREHENDYYFEDAKGHVAGEWDTVREAFTIATEYDVVERGGSRYYFDGRTFVGKDELWDAMTAEPDLVDAIDAAVRKFVLHGELPPRRKKA